MKLVKSSAFAVAVAISAASAPVSAQAPYATDIAEFDGSNAFAFPASASFEFVQGGTIEFWAAADWRSDPGYDPVAISNTGPDGPSYLVAINGDRSGLVVQSGINTQVAPFDFSDGKLHHVAIVDTGEEIFVMIDATVTGVFDQSFSNNRSTGFWVGTANGTDAPYIGAIGGLRLWRVALDPLSLAEYARRDINDRDSPHPDLEFLMAESSFQDGTIFVEPAAETEIEE